MLVRGAIALGLGWAMLGCGAAPASEKGQEETRSSEEAFTLATSGHIPPFQPLPVCRYDTLGAIVTRNDGNCPTLAAPNGGFLVGVDGLSWLASKGRYSGVEEDQEKYRGILYFNEAISSDMISGAQFFCVYEYEGPGNATAYDYARDLRLSGASVAGPECSAQWVSPADHGCPTCGNQVPWQ